MNKIGFGRDIHKIIMNRPMYIGGVLVTGEYGFSAHSDGDIAVHALIDAILGALAMGDIGTLFPNTDMKYKDINSMFLLEETVKIMTGKGYQIGNVDINITLEKPMLRPFISEMKIKIAGCLHTSVDNVSVKAGTNEHEGEIGQGKYGLAHAVVILTKKVNP